MIRNVLILIVIIFSVQFSSAQKKHKSLFIDNDNQSLLKNTESYNPLAPAKAAFYSAVIPGLGQAYNKRYWKIPIVYGALATSLYYYSTNNTAYKRYRRAFKQRKAGKQDEFFNTFSEQSLENAQTILRRNRDTSLLTFVGLYALQILEASIDAHLLQFNISDNIASFDPALIGGDASEKKYVGLSLNFSF